MESVLTLLEVWITRLATAVGLPVLIVPLVRVWWSRRAPRGRSSGESSQLTRWPAIFALAAVYIAIGILLWKPVPLNLPKALHVTLVLVGSLLYFPGILIYAWGFNTLGSMFGVSSARAAQLYHKHRLIDEGPYAIVRHPMYLGVILAAFGALLVFQTWAMVLYAPIALAVILRARTEERLLAEAFGETWTAYARKVPAWIPKMPKRPGDS